METDGQHRQPEEHDGEEDSEEHLGAFCRALAGRLEQGHAVGDRLHAGQRRAPGSERFQDEQHPHHLETAGGCEKAPRRRHPLSQGVDKADDDDREEPDDEQARREQEGPGALTQPSQVENRDDGESPEAERDRQGGEARERRREGAHAGGDRHGDRERVVDDEGGGRQLAGTRNRFALDTA